MEFVQIAQFRQPQEEDIKVNYMSKNSNKSKSKTDRVKITCASFYQKNQVLSCGLSNGTITQFLSQKFNSKKLIDTKDYEIRKFDNLQNMHKGQITCILSERIFNQVFVITGSADRTIKIWDTEPKSKTIAQTITGHAGTITCLAFSNKSDTIFSGSVDKSVRIWKQDQGRKMFMYPWYINYQVITDFCPKKPIDKPVYPTAFELIDGEINNFMLYLGDSEGNLHIIREFELFGAKEESLGIFSQNLMDSALNNSSSKFRTGFQIDRSNFKHHRLNIKAIKYVPKEHLVVTTGYDQYIYGFESLSEKLTLKYQNPKKCLFTSIVCLYNLLIASDEQGSFYHLELSSDKSIEEIKKYNCKINQLFVSRNHRDGELFAVTDDSVDAYRIVRGIKAVEGDDCHTDTIIGIYSLQAYKLTDKKVKDQAKIISVSLDNTLRVWDPTDLSCLEVMPNPQKAEISSLFYLQRANLFVTGHENGMVRLWNIQLQTSITVSQQNSPFAHKNNICAFGEYIHVRGNEDVTEFMFSTGYEGKVNVWQIFLKKSTVQTSLISSSISPQLKNCFFPDDNQQSNDKIGHELFAIQVWQNKSKNMDTMNFQQKTSQVTILTAGTKGYVYFTKMFIYDTYYKEKLHEDSINCMLIDENILFTGSCDNTIKLTNLENMEKLSVLFAHQSAISRMEILSETGHLITQASDGQILFWDYPSQRIVKKIKEKKQTIVCTCYIDQSQIMYVGTQGAKILTFDLSDLYQEPINKQFTFKNKADNEDLLSEESMKNMLKKNQEELERMMKGL